MVGVELCKWEKERRGTILPTLYVYIYILHIIMIHNNKQTNKQRIHPIPCTDRQQEATLKKSSEWVGWGGGRSDQFHELWIWLTVGRKQPCKGSAPPPNMLLLLWSEVFLNKSTETGYGYGYGSSGGARGEKYRGMWSPVLLSWSTPSFHLHLQPSPPPGLSLPPYRSQWMW